MRRKMWSWICAGVLLLWHASAAQCREITQAEYLKTGPQCANHDAAPTVTIRDCTALIKLAKQLNGGYAGFLEFRGRAYRREGDYERALRDINLSIQLDPSQGEPYGSRGNILATEGNYDAAIRDYDKAIELIPYFYECFILRGDAYRLKGNFEKAIQDYDRAMELDPSLKGRAIYGRGLAKYGQGDIASGNVDVAVGSAYITGTVYPVETTNKELADHITRMRKAVGARRDQEALDEAQMADAVDGAPSPLAGEIHRTIVQAAMGLKNWDLAFAQTEKIIAANEDDGLIVNNAFFLAILAGNPEKASIYAARSGKDRVPVYMVELANAYYRHGDIANAKLKAQETIDALSARGELPTDKLTLASATKLLADIEAKQGSQ